ncbi:pnbA, partial [Symbiodinium microadriaticum]
VFIHGGGYVSGTANIPLYDGVDMVDYLQGGAIVVTMNYRLNVFGFIGSEELRGQDVENGSTGNYGIQDQRMAMGWVQKNIGAFGGDNSRVTIFGQSAGAGSVTNHLTMKRSWPLFHGAIVESGAFYESVLQNMSVAAWTYDNFLRAAGCGGLDCLLALPAQDILTAGNSLPSFDPHLTGNPFRPTADGVEISTHPWIAASNGDVADVPVVMGSCADDGAIFTYVPHDLTEEGLCAYWQKKGYSVGDIQRLMEIYVQNGSYNEWEHATVHWWAAQRSNGDKSYTCPAVFASAQLAAQYATEQRSSPTYEYLFSHKPRYANLTRHLADLEFVFHQKELL